MKSTVYRYGLYSMLTLVLISFGAFFLLKNARLGLQEAAGYLSMLLSMIFVFLGIRHFKNNVNGGYLSFGQGLKIGVLIVIIPAVAFGLFDLLYPEVINPTWMEDYYAKHIENLRKSVAAEKLDAAIKKVEKEKEMFSNPAIQFLLMGGTVFIIGFIVSIISSLTLRRSKTNVA
jgi:F0F1-type ATP synthase assembly protein I